MSSNGWSLWEIRPNTKTYDLNVPGTVIFLSHISFRTRLTTSNTEPDISWLNLFRYFVSISSLKRIQIFLKTQISAKPFLMFSRNNYAASCNSLIMQENVSLIMHETMSYSVRFNLHVISSSRSNCRIKNGYLVWPWRIGGSILTYKKYIALKYISTLEPSNFIDISSLM